MRSGASFPSYASQAVWAQVTGAWSGSFPVANLADLRKIRSVAKATDAAARAFTMILPAVQSIQFLALVHHNGVAGTTVRLRLFSDNNPDPVGNAGAIVHDSGVVPMFPIGSAPSSLYPQIRPYRLENAVNARSCRIDLSANLKPWVIGGVELGGFYEWTDVAVPRDFGIRDKSAKMELPDSVNHVMGVWSPRIFAGSREVVDVAEIETTALDFQLEKKTSYPFVYATDLDDTSTWPREVIFVHNNSLPPPTSLLHPSGRMSFDFEEWLR